MFALLAAWPVLDIALLCPPPSAGFIRLILLPSLFLDFPCVTPATPIAPDRLFFNVRSVGRMARPRSSAPVPSSLGLFHPPHSFAKPPPLDFPCATPATPIAPDRLFLNVRCEFFQLVEESLFE